MRNHKFASESKQTTARIAENWPKPEPEMIIAKLQTVSRLPRYYIPTNIHPSSSLSSGVLQSGAEKQRGHRKRQSDKNHMASASDPHARLEPADIQFWMCVCVHTGTNDIIKLIWLMT